MQLNYTLSPSNHLEYQLFAASINPRIRQKRKNNRRIVPLIYLFIGVIGYFLISVSMTIAFVVFSILWYIFYPSWEKLRYIKHYKGYIEDRIKDLKEEETREVRFEILDHHFTAKDLSSDVKIKYTELKDIYEIPNLILIRLKGEQAFIIPKAQLENVELVRQKLMALATAQHVKYNSLLNWKWE